MSIWTKRNLEEKVLPGLSTIEGSLRKEIIEIAETKQPVIVFDLVEATLNTRGFALQESKLVARSASWLAVAKRENQEWFDHIVARLS